MWNKDFYSSVFGLFGLTSFLASNNIVLTIQKIKALRAGNEAVAALERKLVCPSFTYRFDDNICNYMIFLFNLDLEKKASFAKELAENLQKEMAETIQADLQTQALGVILDPNLHQICHRFCDKEMKYEYLGQPCIWEEYYHKYDAPKWSKMYVYYIVLRQDPSKETKFLEIRDNEQEIEKMYNEEFIPLRNQIIEQIKSEYKKSIITGLLAQTSILIVALASLYCINQA
jgi:hypothetical protein